MEIMRTSTVSGITRTIDLPVTQEQIDRWTAGALVQNVFPNLTPAQREFLVTGITDEEWRNLFGGGEEE